MSTPLLEVHDLQIQRGARTVLSVETLTIEPGDVLALIGPNGAGKSTLLLTLARLLQPAAGTIRFRGKSAAEESDLVYRRRIAMVLQEPLLFDMPVFDNVASGLRFRGLSKEKVAPLVERWLARLGIEHLRDRRATELSGGEAQRVNLARALVLEPELLLLDEPFSALDPPSYKRLLAEFAELLAETRTTTIMVTHDFNEAALLGNRIAIVLEGLTLGWTCRSNLAGCP